MGYLGPLFLAFVIMFVLPPTTYLNFTFPKNTFKKYIKLKKFSFLFNGPMKLPFCEYGIALPLFITQIIGYVISLATLIFDIVFYFITKDIDKIGYITTIILIADFAMYFIFSVVFEILAKHRSKYDENTKLYTKSEIDKLFKSAMSQQKLSRKKRRQKVAAKIKAFFKKIFSRNR